MSAHHDPERLHLRPPLVEFRWPHVVLDHGVDARVPADVAVPQWRARETAGQHSVDGTGHPVLIGVVDHLVAGPHHRDLLGRAEEGRPHERHAVRLSGSVAALTDHRGPQLRVLIVHQQRVPVEELRVEGKRLPEVGHEAHRASAQHVLRDHVGVPIDGIGIGEVHEHRIETVLVHQVRLSRLGLDRVALLDRFVVEVSDRRIALRRGIHQPGVDVGGHLDAVLVEVAHQLLPSRVPLPVQLPGPPQPVAETRHPLAGPVLQPHPRDLRARVLHLLDDGAHLVGPALQSEDGATLGPVGQRRSGSAGLTLGHHTCQVLGHEGFGRDRRRPGLKTRLPVT